MFDAAIQVANFGPRSFRPAEARWTIFDGKRKIASGSGNIRQSLSSITHAAQLKITVAFPGTDIANDWSIWVYPASEKNIPANDLAIFQNAGPDFYNALRRGKRVLLLPDKKAVEKPLAVQFVPVFWNPVMFPNQPGTMGAMIDAEHPIFSDFPTDPWTNWQWWELMRHGFAIDCGLFHSRIDAPLRFIDKFNRNALPAGIIEAKVGAGSLIICTLDIAHDLDTRIVARQLRRSLLSYMSGARFQPRSRLTESELRSVVGD